MDFSSVIAVGSFVAAGISAGIAYKAVRQARRLQEKQWKRDELTLRRDVLRRLVAYGYRLTPKFTGQDGEPLIAMNEALIVFADFPQVIDALTRIHNKEGCLSRNIVAVVRAMADAADISIESLDDRFLESPFTPQKTQS